MIYTSYFHEIKAILAKDPQLVLVSIAGKTPEWLEGVCFEVLKYKPLMPQFSWWNEWHQKFAADLESVESKAWYKQQYEETVLSRLTPAKVWQDLMDMSHHHNVVLLCYEAPDKFCHRHLVSAWLEAGGIICKELSLH